MNIVKLKPALVSYIWGGDRLHPKFNKDKGENIGEAWELSYNKEKPCLIASGENVGTPLMDVASSNDVGDNSKGMEFFPLLIKLIDPAQNLSVQVHPSDEYALKNENQYGKTEMWYIVDAGEDAYIYFGLKEEVSKEELPKLMESGDIEGKLNRIDVKNGDVFMVNSGTIHAIGKNALLYEVQQNSTLTYRLYDYKRVDKFGNERELHREKAAAVTNLAPLKVSQDNKHIETVIDDGTNLFRKTRLGYCKYFYSEEYETKGEVTTMGAKDTFMVLTVVSGNGTIDGIDVVCGDTVFVPSNHKEFTIKGEMKAVMSKVVKYYVGIDLGGTMIKGGVVTSDGEVLYNTQIDTETKLGSEKVVANIIKLVQILLDETKLQSEDLVGIGVGIPGTIDSKDRVVKYSNNLHWKNVDLKPIGKHFNLPIKATNDANAAALGEALFGVGKNYKDSILLTLGTGVGSGIVLDKKIYEGNYSAGAEIGHTVICVGGEPCTCGRRGCFEAYASATALIRMAKKEMESNPNSKMWTAVNGDIEKVEGKTVVSLINEDESAKKVFDEYLMYLSEGIANVANTFRPEVIMLGGGVANAGDTLIKPLQKLVSEKLFGGDLIPTVKVAKATRKNDAGFLGAAGLLM